MIPILYESTEKDFTTNGLGRLKDAISCSVKEERNGTYELSMIYPISGIHYDLIENDRIIYAMPADGKGPQPFRIYKISKPLSGQVTISAEHISYLLAAAVVMPFTASSCADAINKLNNNIIGASGFSFSTDKAVSGTYTLDKPTEVRTVLGGSSGSLLDTYGKGEYEFDHFDVILHLNRGVDNGVTIRYGKNLTDLTAEYDMTNVYTGIVPYATSQDSDGNEITVTLPEGVIKSSHTGDYAYPLYKVVDFSQDSDRESTLTEDELRTLAKAYVTDNEGWEVATNLTVSFVALWQTDEYKNLAALERVNLCDTVHVVYTDLGVNTTAKVIATDFDVLNERYNSVELGENTTNLSKTISDAINSSTDSLKDEVSALPAAITKATKKITGGLGGYIVIKQNANGQPEELLIMDTDDVTTAVNVWRWNKGGLGHSHNGYDGPFDDVAITQDGAIVADYITTGTLNADLIKAGVITDLLGRFYLNMATGDLNMSEATLNNCHILTTNGYSVNISDGMIRLFDASGDMTMLISDNAIYFQGANGYTYYTADSVGFYDSNATAKAYLGRARITYGSKYSHNDGGGDGVYIDANGISVGEASGWAGQPVFQVNTSGSFSNTTCTGLRITRSDGSSGGYINARYSNQKGWYLNTSLYCEDGVSGGSDERLKQDIEGIPLSESEKLIYGLIARKYRYKNNPNTLHHGFIAQEALNVLSDEAIVELTQLDDCEEDIHGEYYAMNYIDIIADVVNVIQSQHKRITALEERLAKIEEALNADN